MLRKKALADKMILLGIDGMDPHLTRKFMDEGKMPNVKKLVEMGAAREDLSMLGGVPTITPPMWTTLATGAYPMTHGITDFNLSPAGELDFTYTGIYSTSCHAEQLWNVTAEAGKKTLVWHWPGASWPPSSDSENLMVVDGTSPGALGFSSLRSDFELLAVASDITKETTIVPNVVVQLDSIHGNPEEVTSEIDKWTAIYPKKQERFVEFRELLSKEVGDFNGYKIGSFMDFRFDILLENQSNADAFAAGALPIAYSPFTAPMGWSGEVPEGAKEFTIQLMFGKVHRPCLLLKNAEGKYDRVAYYVSKNDLEPVVVLENDVLTPVPDMGVTFATKEPCHVYRNMRIMELAEDGSIVKIWISDAMDIDSKAIFYPQWIHDEIYERFGYPAPTSLAGCFDKDIMYKCTHAQWELAAKWQAESLKYMLDEKGVDVIFSHYHGPDLEGHTYTKYLKQREDSRYSEEEIMKRCEATYTLTDWYIGQFIPYIEKGYVLNLFSDHALVCREESVMHKIGDNYGLNTGVLAELGYTVMMEDEAGHRMIDWSKTRAVQQRSNSVYINLKGRDRFGIVDSADKYELEEQIITDLYGYKDPKTGKRIVSLALHNKDAVLLGVGGPYAADIIFFIHDDYVTDHGESLSTATGFAGTTTAPVYVIAGPGVKENYRIKGWIREVDVAPTAAVLLGVDIPAQCEGAPAYQIFSEKL